MATVGQMANGIIHDIRGPLAAISNAADLIARADLTPAQRQVLAQSQVSSSKRLNAMLGEILEFSRGDYGLTFSHQNLAALVDSVIQECINPQLAPGVKLEVDVPPNLVVRVDCGRVRRIFQNLLGNSIQAMPRGGTVKVVARRAGDRVRINISDTGSGIPAQLRNRLFEPFVSQGKQGGTGLGLAIARSIAEAHGGSLTLVSADYQPADFCVELPLETEG